MTEIRQPHARVLGPVLLQRYTIAGKRPHSLKARDLYSLPALPGYERRINMRFDPQKQILVRALEVTRRLSSICQRIEPGSDRCVGRRVPLSISKLFCELLMNCVPEATFSGGVWVNFVINGVVDDLIQVRIAIRQDN